MTSNGLHNSWLTSYYSTDKNLTHQNHDNTIFSTISIEFGHWPQMTLFWPVKKEYYQSRQRRIGSSQSGPESSSSGPDDSSSYHFSYGKSNGYGIPSIGVPGRAIVIRCENKEIKKSDPSITKERVIYESYIMNHKIMTFHDLKRFLSLLTFQFSRKDRPVWTVLFGIFKPFNFMYRPVWFVIIHS